MNSRKFQYFLLTLLIILTSCSKQESNNPTAVVTIIRETELVVETIIVRETVLVPVTVTPTFTPVNSPTPTLTPTITPTPTITSTPTNSPTPTRTPNYDQTATVDAYGALTQPKRNGIFTVGTEILPGKWESQGTNDDCYWAIYDTNQNIVDNHFGMAGGTVTILPSHYEVEFDDCSQWIYVEGAERELREDAVENKSSGFYTIGVEIVPGRWESQGTGDSCYWAILDANQNIIRNHFGNAGGTVTLTSSQYEVYFDDCGTWIFLGP